MGFSSYIFTQTKKWLKDLISCILSLKQIFLLYVNMCTINYYVKKYLLKINKICTNLLYLLMALLMLAMIPAIFFGVHDLPFRPLTWYQEQCLWDGWRSIGYES